MNFYFFPYMLLYGVFCLTSGVSRADDLTRLQKIISWPTSWHLDFSVEKLSFGILFDNRIPDKAADHYTSEAGLNVVLLGNIYNRDELIHKLNFPDEISSSELIAKYFSLSGPDFINNLNGEFVILIYNIFSDRLILFRDHLGIYPLAYTFEADSLWFSSDQISLCRLFGASEEINREPMMDYFKMIDFNQLYSTNIHKLLPGHYLEVVNNKQTITKYWHPEKIRIDKTMTKQSLISDMGDLIKRAIQIRVDSRYTAGTHISGGLDSGIVAAYTRKFYDNQSDFYGFCWSPDKFKSESLEFDERILVNEQCKLNQIIPRFMTLDISAILKYLSDPLKYSSFLAENKVLEEASDLKINLIFSGYGGDEFISKGDRGINTDLLGNLQLIHFLRHNPVRRLKSFLRTLLYDVIFPFAGILTPPVRKFNEHSVKYLNKKYQKPDKKNIRKFYYYKSRRSLQLGLLYCYYLPQRMEDWYIKGIRSGIQYRYPLLDKDIVEYSLKIPSKLLYKEEYSRIILREISKGMLPESVRWKKKGTDPVAFSSINLLAFECAEQFIKEIDSFAINPELDFIAFDKIKEDIKRYENDPDRERFSDLLFTIFEIKRLHEFTKAFRAIL